MLDIEIETEIIDPEDPEMLRDLIIAATADAKKNVAAQANQKLSELTGGIDLSALGINLPGLT